ncbi:hypothetical protein SAMN05443575_2673 [Jatrophihabitans endophyticus]|uniref:Uncharacterized protein n=1 Tax=Jatrophihabitans endophyticus TaxID=1206085 RepID=A0A1M5MAC2_9ACTN|nr:DUF2231 domain-containing protein [Jatrophihabitans endophyticus]SHG74230.1 hypothetical protein SAMN05443575_2673 [Jatrophihabitans endophyticus]
MPTEIGGLPAHVLLIHAIVVLAPLGALFTILSAVWPAARHKLGVISPLTCLVVLALVPVTTNAGEWLEDRLTENGPNAAIEKHADLGDTFLWFAIGLFVVSAAVWWVGRVDDRAAATRPEATRPEADGTGGPGGPGATATAVRPTARTAVPVAVRVAVAVVAIAVSLVTVWQLYRIGDTGADATWDFVQKLK